MQTKMYQDLQLHNFLNQVVRYVTKRSLDQSCWLQVNHINGQSTPSTLPQEPGGGTPMNFG